jgi:hypothetical protein
MTFIEWMRDQGIEIFELTLDETAEYYEKYIKMYGLDV